MTKLPDGTAKTETMGPISKTESEPDAGVCEAEEIAYLFQGQAKVLCPRVCTGSARSEPAQMLAQDAAISDVRDAPELDGAKTSCACPYRAQAYESPATARKCAGSRCFQEKTVEKDGFYLCKAHAADRSVTR